jgi:hypothetical protein
VGVRRNRLCWPRRPAASIIALTAHDARSPTARPLGGCSSRACAPQILVAVATCTRQSRGCGCSSLGPVIGVDARVYASPPSMYVLRAPRRPPARGPPLSVLATYLGLQAVHRDRRRARGRPSTTSGSPGRGWHALGLELLSRILFHQHPERIATLVTTRPAARGGGMLLTLRHDPAPQLGADAAGEGAAREGALAARPLLALLQMASGRASRAPSVAPEAADALFQACSCIRCRERAPAGLGPLIGRSR